jgi:hypothetical protein
MQLLQQLWVEETGAVLSAEVVTVATIAVLSSVVGLNALTTSVNGEFTDMCHSFRSLNQSYFYAEQRSCRAWFAGSCYTQVPVEQSLATFCASTPGCPPGQCPAIEGPAIDGPRIETPKTETPDGELPKAGQPQRIEPRKPVTDQEQGDVETPADKKLDAPDAQR